MDINITTQFQSNRAAELSYPMWGTGRLGVSTEPQYYDKPTLCFSTGFSRIRNNHCEKRYICSNHQKPKQNMKILHKYRGLDLVVKGIGNIRRLHFIVKTRYIILLQKQIRKFIRDKRRKKFIPYIKRTFKNKNICDDTLGVVVNFII